MSLKISASTCRRWTMREGNETRVVDASSGYRRRGGSYPDGSFYCMHGCCEYKSNGCCDFGRSRTMVFGALATAVIVIGGLCLCFVCRSVGMRRRRRLERENQNGASAVSVDNPPSYDSCVHEVNENQDSPADQTLVALGVENIGFDQSQEVRGTLSQPPAYGEIFKEGNTGKPLQVAVINAEGHVSFVDWKDVTFTRTNEGKVEKIALKSEVKELVNALQASSEKIETVGTDAPSSSTQSLKETEPAGENSAGTQNQQSIHPAALESMPSSSSSITYPVTTPSSSPSGPALVHSSALSSNQTSQEANRSGLALASSQQPSADPSIVASANLGGDHSMGDNEMPQQNTQHL